MGRRGPKNRWQRYGALGGRARAQRYTREELSAMARGVAGAPERRRLADLEPRTEGKGR